MSEQTTIMSEADINRRAAAHMGQVSWPTVWLALGSVVTYFLLIGLTAAGLMPAVPAFLLGAYLVYATYTPLHEAVHRNICGRERNLLWLNNLIGYLVATVLGVSFTMHRSAHMAHHRATNIAGEDPDLVTTERSLWAVLTCGSKMVISEYRDYFGRVFPRASAKERITVLLEIFVFVGWRVALALNGYAAEVLLLAVLANMAGVTLLGFLFAWVVHTPFDETERYRDTATILLPSAVHGFLTRLWLWQNYHSIHHLFPRVPYYRYADLFDEIRPGMTERGAPIVELGARAAAQRAAG
jgi:beta-carotene hydroxylase